MDLTRIPVLEGDLPSTAEPNKRYVFLRVTNGSQESARLALRLTPQAEPSEQTRLKLTRQYPGTTVEVLATGPITLNPEGDLKITRGSDRLWDPSIDAANLFRIALGTRVEMLTVPLQDKSVFALRA